MLLASRVRGQGGCRASHDAQDFLLPPQSTSHSGTSAVGPAVTVGRRHIQSWEKSISPFRKQNFYHRPISKDCRPEAEEWLGKLKKHCC